MVARLAEMLPDTAEEDLLDAVLTTQDLDRAFDYITERKRITDPHQAQIVDELQSLFPKVDRVILTDLVSAFPECNVEEMIDIIIHQLMKTRISNKTRFTKLNCVNDQSAPVEVFSNVSSFREAISLSPPSGNSVPDNKTQIPLDNTTVFKYDFGIDDSTDLPLESQEYRQMAQDLIERRAVIFGKASAAYQQGGLTGRGYAGYLSSEAASMTSMIEVYNGMAAKKAFTVNNPQIANSLKIDLHGLTVREVEPLLHAYLKHHFYTRESGQVQIVTGHGRGSSQGARLRPIVYNLLSSFGRPFTFDNYAVFTVFRK